MLDALNALVARFALETDLAEADEVAASGSNVAVIVLGTPCALGCELSRQDPEARSVSFQTLVPSETEKAALQHAAGWRARR